MNQNPKWATQRDRAARRIESAAREFMDQEGGFSHDAFTALVGGMIEVLGELVGHWHNLDESERTALCRKLVNVVTSGSESPELLAAAELEEVIDFLRSGVAAPEVAIIALLAIQRQLVEGKASAGSSAASVG